jgi:hypothetical protein
VDGTTLRIADTPENEERFGRPGSSPKRGRAGYPQLRVVALMVLRSHLLASVSLGGWSQGEITLAQALWPKVPDRFAEVNAVYAEFLPNEPPARKTVQVARLPKGAQVEIKLTAVRARR